jgi:uncharacterized protein with ParB-like and HNH nuclease domain
MPIQANVLDLSQAFGGQVLYRIPQFQRLYSWNRDDQWKPLWDDLVDIVERIRDNDDGVMPHFMGAIVVQPLDDEVTVRVIDGQQRLTTLQILIVALKKRFLHYGYQDLANDLHSVAINNDGSVKIEQANPLDKLAFKTVLTGHIHGPEHPINSAFEFFCTAANHWLEQNAGHLRAKCEGLRAATLSLLQLVSISLDSNEKPHDVFEVLNARAHTLRQSDLVRNFMMQEAQVFDDPVRAHLLWGHFDDDPWWREAHEGDTNRLDQFLNVWIAMKNRRWCARKRVASNIRNHFDQGRQTIDNLTSSSR